jgi:AmmeMemoRadiSam system protein A
MSKPSPTQSENQSESLTASLARPDRVSSDPSLEFSSDARKTLLHIAHHAILSVLEHQPIAEEPPCPASLSEPRGVFTTLYLRGQQGRELRGCVGYVVPVAPLYRAVAESARAAAFEDSRFPPVTKEEAPKLEISLSVLSRLFPIHPNTVEIGRHGLVVSRGGRRGLLLPQVPIEHGWDRETFLQETCRKAGLPLDAWCHAATIEAFTAEVFSDELPTPLSPRVCTLE